MTDRNERLTSAQKRHLLELLTIYESRGSAAWGPESPGEWSCARALERKGLLSRNVSRGHLPYTLTERGREVAAVLS
jgi:hypothetical protein